MKILNTIVYYNNRCEVEKYITEVDSMSDGIVDIALIINNDQNNELSVLKESLRKKGISCVLFFDYGENIGYLNAMLKTLKLVDIGKYDYVILSNTDIHYDTTDFFDKLIQNKYPNTIGCIAPCVFATKSNSYSNPHYTERIEKRKLERVVRIFKYPLLGKMYLKLSELKARKERNEKQPSGYVYSPHGCYMIFTNSFISKISGYEYGVKMYSEESAVGELLSRYHMRCYYDERITVIHQESSVTGKIDYKKRFSLWRASLIYILDTFYE